MNRSGQFTHTIIIPPLLNNTMLKLLKSNDYSLCIDVECVYMSKVIVTVEKQYILEVKCDQITIMLYTNIDE